MTSKVSRQCSDFSPSDPGVTGAEPRDAHDLTGREIMLVSALTPSSEKIHKNPARNCVSEPRTEAGRGTGRAAGRKLIQVLAPWGGQRGVEEEKGVLERRLVAHRLLLIDTQLHPLKSSL